MINEKLWHGEYFVVRILVGRERVSETRAARVVEPEMAVNSSWFESPLAQKIPRNPLYRSFWCVFTPMMFSCEMWCLEWDEMRWAITISEVLEMRQDIPPFWSRSPFVATSSSCPVYYTGYLWKHLPDTWSSWDLSTCYQYLRRSKRSLGLVLSEPRCWSDWWQHCNAFISPFQFESSGRLLLLFMIMRWNFIHESQYSGHFVGELFQ